MHTGNYNRNTFIEGGGGGYKMLAAAATAKTFSAFRMSAPTNIVESRFNLNAEVIQSNRFSVFISNGRLFSEQSYSKSFDM